MGKAKDLEEGLIYTAVFHIPHRVLVSSDSEILKFIQHHQDLLSEDIIDMQTEYNETGNAFD